MTEKEKQKHNDEKIKEAILNGLIDCRDAPDLGWSNFGGIHIDDCITWLEKQCKQKKQVHFPKLKKRFDPKTLKLHNRVLVRDEHKYSWATAYFYHIEEDSDYPYMTTRSAYRYCIPYNDDTKYLDGRKEQPQEYYRYWED